VNINSLFHGLVIYLHVCYLNRFFDITPVGRILNRMSGGIQIIDQVRILIALWHFSLPDPWSPQLSPCWSRIFSLV